MLRNSVLLQGLNTKANEQYYYIFLLLNKAETHLNRINTVNVEVRLFVLVLVSIWIHFLSKSLTSKLILFIGCTRFSVLHNSISPKSVVIMNFFFLSWDKLNLPFLLFTWISFIKEYTLPLFVKTIDQILKRIILLTGIPHTKLAIGT